MKAALERNIPSEYPNPYVYSSVMKTNFDREAQSYEKNAIQLICWLRTPKGALSKHFCTMSKSSDKVSVDELYHEVSRALISYTKDTYRSEINRGYSIDRVFIYEAQYKED